MLCPLFAEHPITCKCHETNLCLVFVFSDAQNTELKDITNISLTQFEVIPSTEIVKEINDMGVTVSEEKKFRTPDIVEIKPLVDKKLPDSASRKPIYRNKKVAKMKKWRFRLARKQRNNMKKKNMLRRLKLIRKQQLKRKRQLLNKNKRRNSVKKQLRTIDPNNLNNVIDHIISQQRNGGGSKVPTDYIRKQILDLIKDTKSNNGTTKSLKDCVALRPKKRKSRKRLRRLNNRRLFNSRPRKFRVVLRGRQRNSVAKGKGKGKEFSSMVPKTFPHKNVDLKTSVATSKGRKRKAKSRKRGRLGRKNKQRIISKKDKTRLTKYHRSRKQ